MSRAKSIVVLKNNEENRGIASLILKFNTSICFTARLFCPSATSEYEVGRVPGPVWTFLGKETKVFVLQGLEHRTVASCYTDWVIPALNNMCWKYWEMDIVFLWFFYALLLKSPCRPNNQISPPRILFLDLLNPFYIIYSLHFNGECKIYPITSDEGQKWSEYISLLQYFAV